MFTGDTQPCERVVELARGADVLVSMCGNFQSSMDERGVATGQTGTLGAAEMAAEAGVNELYLVHVGPELSSAEGRVKGIAEIESVFDGHVTMTDELQTYEWNGTDRTTERDRPGPGCPSEHPSPLNISVP